jgi:LCP family protein required for cell wall assembly
MNAGGSSVRAFFGRFLIALVVGSVLMAGAVSGVNREIGQKLDRIPKINLATAPLPPEGANYLLIGADNLGGKEADELEISAFGDRSQNRNSDTMMVIHVEPRAERTLVVSFPRDLWLNVPGHGRSKLNGAYQYGPQAVIDTISTNFGIEIHHYLELNFLSFVGLVNDLGKVPVYVPYAAMDTDTGLDIPHGGCVELDGEQSLQWVRTRSLKYLNEETGRWVAANEIAPDLARIARQQDFMRTLAAIAVTKSLANPFTANSVADKVVDNLKADDSFDKGSVASLIDSFRGLNTQDTSELDFQTVPTRAGKETLNGQVLDVLYPQMDLAEPLLQRLKAFDTRPRPTPAPASIRLRIVNASGRPELGTAVRQQFEALGFIVTEAVDSPGPRVNENRVTYAQGQGDKAKLILRYVEPRPNLELLATTVRNADVEIVLGRSFNGIVVPADQQSTSTTATTAPVDAIVDTPIELPPPPPDVVLPNPAPRNGC